MQYADYLNAKLCKVAGVYNDGNAKDVFIEYVDGCILPRLRQYSEQNSQADLTDIATQAESLLSVRKGA